MIKETSYLILIWINTFLKVCRVQRVCFGSSFYQGLSANSWYRIFSASCVWVCKTNHEKGWVLQRERERELSKVLNQLDLFGGSRRLVSHFWGSFCQNIMFLWCTFTRMPALSLFCFSCSHLVKIMIPTFDCMLYFLSFLCTSLHSVYSSGRTFLLFPMFYYWHKQHMRRHCGINSVSSCSQFMWGKRRLLYTLKGEAQSQQLSCILYSYKSELKM